MRKSMITVNNNEVSIRDWEGQRVITFNDIDNVHNRPAGTASRNFKTNRDKFKAGIDYYFLTRNPIDEFRPLEEIEEMRGFKIPPKGITLITQSGYLMIVKSFTDELSWKIQRQLVDNYFNPQSQQPAIASCESQPPATSDLPIELQMMDQLMSFAKLSHQKMQEHERIMVEQDSRITALEERKPEEILVEPSPEYYLQATNCSVSKDYYMITAIAEAFGMSGQVLNKYLYAHGIIRPYNGGWDINKKAGSESCVMLKTNSFTNRDGIKELRTITYWTYEGMVFLCEYLKAEGFTQSRSIAKFDRNAASKKRTKKKAKAKAKTKKKIDDAQMTLGVK